MVGLLAVAAVPLLAAVLIGALVAEGAALVLRAAAVGAGGDLTCVEVDEFLSWVDALFAVSELIVRVALVSRGLGLLL